MTAPIAEQPATISDQIPAKRTELIALMREVYHEELKAAGKKVLSLEEIKQEFLKLPGEEYRAYESAITGFARDWADFIIKKKQEDDPEPPILQLLSNHKLNPAPVGSDEEKCAFAAFAVAINYERLQKNPHHEKAFLDDYRAYFGKCNEQNIHEHIYFFHLDVLYRMDEAKINHNDEFLKKLITDAKTNSDNLVNNHGGLHAFAETVALVFENASDELLAELKASSKDDWMKIAKKAAQEAIDKDIEEQKIQAHKKGIYDGKFDAYAKFYCTRGRIEALCGELEAAIKSVNEAIKLEKNTRTDYSIRIGQYAGYEQQFRAQQKLQVQERAMADQMHEMNLLMEQQEKESMAKNMEFLGLFSGIVSFTIGSLSITGAIAEQSIKHAAGLIVVLMGALMCVFAAFGIILHGFHMVKRDKKTQKFERSFMYRHLIVFGLGALVVAGGILFCLS